MSPRVPPHPDEYERLLAEFQELLRTVEIVGFPRRSVEIARLQGLIERYTEETREMLAEQDQRRA